MITHLSVRLCWHDAGWNGRICKNPQKNRYCINLDHIRKNRDPEFESFEIANKGKCVADFDYEEVHVPCRNEICVFSPKGYIIKHYHPLRKIPGYDLAPCTEKFFPYALYPAPYRWLMVKHYDNIRKEEKLNLMSGASFFVMPSPNESFSIVTLEAMAQKTPVLASSGSEAVVEHIRKKNLKTKMKLNEAYSDHISDIHLLKLVGKPYAVNPEPMLRRYAKRKKIPIIRFSD